MDSENRRRDFRVEITIPARWKKLTDEELNLLKCGNGINLLKQTDLSSPIDDILQQTAPGSQEEGLYKSLQLINNKLDFIIEQMLFGSGESSFHQDQVTDISGSGLRLVSQEELSPGTMIRLILLMPGTFQYQVELIVEVIRVEKAPAGFIAATQIIVIDEAARDTIIKVVFKKHRHEIRREKLR